MHKYSILTGCLHFSLFYEPEPLVKHFAGYCADTDANEGTAKHIQWEMHTHIYLGISHQSCPKNCYGLHPLMKFAQGKCQKDTNSKVVGCMRRWEAAVASTTGHYIMHQCGKLRVGAGPQAVKYRLEQRGAHEIAACKTEDKEEAPYPARFAVRRRHVQSQK